MLMGSLFAEAPLPDVAALPGCMLSIAGGRKGLAEKLGNGLSSGGMQKGLACFCDLACLPACLGRCCPACPAQPSRHTVTRSVLIAEQGPQSGLTAKRMLILDARTRNLDKVQSIESCIIRTSGGWPSKLSFLRWSFTVTNPAITVRPLHLYSRCQSSL